MVRSRQCPNRLELVAVEGSPVLVETQHAAVAAEAFRRRAVGVAGAGAVDDAVGLGEGAHDLVRDLVAHREDLRRLQASVQAVRPDGAAGARIHQDDVDLEAVRPDRRAAGEDVVGADLRMQAVRRSARQVRRLGVEHPQRGEPGQGDDQRPGEAAGEAREGGGVAFLLERGDEERRSELVAARRNGGLDRLRVAGLEGGNVGSLRDGDPHRIVAAAGQVVALQRPAQAAGLDPDDGVELRVEAVVAPEDRGGDVVGLDALGASREGLLDDVPEKPAVPFGGVEIRGGEHALQSEPDFIRAKAWHGRRHFRHQAPSGVPQTPSRHPRPRGAAPLNRIKH